MSADLNDGREHGPEAVLRHHDTNGHRVNGTMPDDHESWLDPDWAILNDRRGDLPDFPVEVLPPAWQHWAGRAARGAGVLPDHVIVPLLSVASSLIGSARRVGASSSWPEPLSLWAAVVGYSGSGKTPGIDVTLRALSRIERSRKDNVDELRTAHEQKATAAKAALSKWKKEVQEAVDKRLPPPARPAGIDDPGPFIAPRFCVTDVTIERLAVLNNARPRGMLAVVDELAGLFTNMSRYSNGSDCEFWLRAWNGGYHAVERKSSPPVVVENLLVGLTGGFQPDKLAAAFRGASDGMYARFLFAWPAEPDYQALSDDVAEVEPEFQEALMRLIDLPDDDIPRNIPLSSQAREEFEQFRQLRHATKNALDGREREVWAKSEKHVLRLAGTLAFMEWAMYSPPSLVPDAAARFQQTLKQASEPTEIDARFVAAAVLLWREYFWPHAKAALRLVGLSDEHKDARCVLKWVKGKKLSEVSLKDVRREALSHRLTAEETQKVIDRLMRAGWLRKKDVPRNGPGKPAHRWVVNPQLLGA